MFHQIIKSKSKIIFKVVNAMFSPRDVLAIKKEVNTIECVVPTDIITGLGVILVFLDSWAVRTEVLLSLTMCLNIYKSLVCLNIWQTVEQTDM